MSKLQDALTQAVVSGDYNSIATAMAEMNRENAKTHCMHEFVKLEGQGGWPGGQQCKHCERRTPEVFCRKPHLCMENGRCMAEHACND